MTDEWVAVLLQGRKYRIRYMLETQRRVREGVATYLGAEKAPLNRSGTKLIFSGRPQFGTMEIDLHCLTDQPIEVVETMECYMDRRV